LRARFTFATTAFDHLLCVAIPDSVLAPRPEIAIGLGERCLREIGRLYVPVILRTALRSCLSRAIELADLKICMAISRAALFLAVAPGRRPAAFPCRNGTGRRPPVPIAEKFAVLFEIVSRFREIRELEIYAFELSEDGAAHGFDLLLRNIRLTFRNFTLQAQLAWVWNILRDAETM